MAFNANDYPTAIFNAIVADTLAAIAGDLHYRGMANNLIALSYRQIADFDKELQYAERSYEQFCQNNDSLRSRLVLMNIGVCYLELEETEKALEIFLRPDCTESYRHIAQCFLELDRMPEFHKVVEEHPELKTSARLNFRHAMKLIKEGQFAEADTLIHTSRLQPSTATDSMEYLVAEGELYHATGQWQKFSEYVIKANHTIDNWLRKVYSEYDSQGQIQAHDYVHRPGEARDNQLRHTLILMVGVLTILLLIVIIIMIVMRLKHVNRLHQQELTIKDVLRENNLSQDRLRAMDGNINKLQSELTAVHDKFTALTASYQSLLSVEKAKIWNILLAKLHRRCATSARVISAQAQPTLRPLTV